MTLTVPEVDARSLGALIALFERTVGLYAALINVNAYHQPGVEAGKKAAAAVLALQQKVLDALGPQALTADELATKAGVPDSAETVFKLCEHLAANGRAVREAGARYVDAKFRSPVGLPRETAT
jgi:glucose-6-phosphate isomerase